MTEDSLEHDTCLINSGPHEDLILKLSFLAVLEGNSLETSSVLCASIEHGPLPLRGSLKLVVRALGALTSLSS